MTRFYGSVQGSAAEATRTGHREIHAHPRGWDLGLQVDGYINDDDRDAFTVSITGGSHDGRATIFDVLQVSADADGQIRIAVNVGDHGFVTYRQTDGTFATRPQGDDQR